MTTLERGPSEVDCTWKANLAEELDTFTQTSKTKFQGFADEINQRAQYVMAAEAKLREETKRQHQEIEEKGRRVDDEIREKQQRLEDEKKSMENVYKFQCGKVKLDVGGHKFTTSLTTLKSQPDSMLAVMFSGRHQLATDEDGAYFIDRDGTHYRHILNYLRDDTNLEETLPQTKREQLELLKEAQYCQLNKLETKIKMMMLPRVTQEQLNTVFWGNQYNRPIQPVYQPRRRFQRSWNSFISDGGCAQNSFISDGGHQIATARLASQSLSYEERDLSELNFSNTHFSCAGISFKRSCLRQANFSGCCFEPRYPVDFSGTDLSEADFQRCAGLITGGVNFEGAILDNAKFDDGVEQKLLAKLQSEDK
ncbi:uncharacterized protein LOC134196823 [Corticium candelabrum]|uniref:uncharacterized protein LOC134196823 n=1 Tax=Corticium candelabrum TaxID=121492 RepID=UPI002E254628|nr:uncharacterized protein LOC134196823 [Corticium candelabrum]